MIAQQYDISEVSRLYDLQHTAKNLQALSDTTAGERLKRISKIEDYLLDQDKQEALCQALWYDLRKSRAEVLETEIVPIMTLLTHLKKSLRGWMRPKRVSAPLAMLGIKSYLRYEPKGHILIISPWNYPLMLTISPLIHAIAAGNACIIKPSEYSAATSAFMKQMIAELFPEHEVAVIEGDVPVSTALLEHKFHHIYFTGSPAVGKIVMKAASQHLTSVTLELGGKSPCIVDESVDIKKVAAQVAWGKCLNGGQTCIAPDYLILHESIKVEFLQAYQDWVQQAYNSDGKGIQQSPHFPRMINEKNFDRIQTLIDQATEQGATVYSPQASDRDDKFIAPTLVDHVTWDMEIMQEEIFGPPMPVITYRELEEIPAMIKQLPKPLALYIMSKRRKTQKYILDNTSAGGTVINELMITPVNPNLPFGGVNNSGIGKSNGHYSFVEFSNERGIMKRQFLDFRMLFPPYNTPKLFAWLVKLSRW